MTFRPKAGTVLGNSEVAS